MSTVREIKVPLDGTGLMEGTLRLQILIGGEAEPPPSSYAEHQSTPKAETVPMHLIWRGGQEYGPFRWKDIRLYYSMGSLQADDLVCVEDGCWVTLGSLLETPPSLPRPHDLLPVKPGAGFKECGSAEEGAFEPGFMAPVAMHACAAFFALVAVVLACTQTGGWTGAATAWLFALGFAIQAIRQSWDWLGLGLCLFALWVVVLVRYDDLAPALSLQTSWMGEFYRKPQGSGVLPMKAGSDGHDDRTNDPAPMIWVDYSSPGGG